MFTQIDKGRHALPCEINLKAPYTRHRLRKCNCQTSRRVAQWVIVYVHMQPRQETPENGKVTADQRIQWGEPTRWIGVTNQMNHEGYHPRPWAPWNRLPWTQVCIATLATTGTILRRPCPCRSSHARGRSENWIGVEVWRWPGVFLGQH